MRHTPPLWVAIALGTAKTLILLVVLAMSFGIVGGTATGATDAGAARRDLATPEPLAFATVVEKAIRRHDCSVVGFDAGVVPRSALVRHDGRLRHVSFDDGWAVFTGERTGQLIAVCLDDY